MSPLEPTNSWTPRDGMPSSGDPALDALHERVLSECPVPADAIVWLQGNRYDRGPKVLELFQARYAPRIVLTGNLQTRDPRVVSETTIATVQDLAGWLLAHGISQDSMMIDDASYHTRDQATHVIAMAQQRHWERFLLVASPHHQLRAFLTFLRRAGEVGWSGRLVNQSAALAWDDIPSERDRTARELFQDECSKLAHYAQHVSMVGDGLSHLSR